MAKKNASSAFSTSSARQSEIVNISSTDYTVTAAAPRGIFVDVAGVVSGRLIDDDIDTTWSLAAGVVYPLAFGVVYKTATTATGIKIIC